MSCSVPITTLLASPYNLPWGSSIFAQISATNSYGTSVLSQGDNGAIILTVPSAVVVSNYDAGTSATQIVINWTEAPENGGTLVLDYEIQLAVGTDGTYSIIESSIGANILTYTYNDVDSGQTYKFKVRARNSEGYGLDSNEEVILAAQIPNQPIAPAPYFTPDTVTIDWMAPNEGGS